MPGRRPRIKAALSFAALFLCAVAPLVAQRGAPPAPANPFLGQAEAVTEGEILYNQHCATCHGAGASGGDIGPPIVSADRLDIGVSDAQTFNLIKNGVAGTRMAPQRLPETDIWRVVTYIHALRGTAIDNPLPGDVADGEQVFWGKGQCGQCHMLGGKGALTAPDLTNIAGMRKSGTIA
jgi:mono/diheme cytochrome c family protein